MKKESIIVGAGSYGQVYAEYLKDEYKVIGFIDDNKELHGKKIGEVEIVGNFDYLLENVNSETAVFVPIGNNKIRVKLLKRLKEHRFRTPTFVHPDTCIHESVIIGEAVYILPGTNIMPLTILENFVMISMGVNIAHHNILEEGVFLSQGVNVGASLSIKKNAFCGIGSTIMTGVKSVGENSLIGAGAVIIKDVPDGATAVGNPGRIIKMQGL